MRDQDWFILRTAGRSTLHLARTLNEDGFDIWAPVLTQTIRVPRMDVVRQIKLPLLPGFVFVRARHLVDILDLAKSPLSRHREFSVFCPHHQIPIIADHHLDALRRKELEAVPRDARPAVKVGGSVRVINGPFQGLIGRVVRCKSGYAKLIIGTWPHPVEISTFLLAEEEVSSPPTDERAPRHRNAVKYLRRAA